MKAHYKDLDDDLRDMLYYEDQKAYIQNILENIESASAEEIKKFITYCVSSGKPNNRYNH